MIINNIGCGQRHDADFIVDRPGGSGDFLLLLLDSGAIFHLGNRLVKAPPGTIFFYSKGQPQVYTGLPQHAFVNDWIHFDFEADEEERFLSLGLTYGTPITLSNPHFARYCIKAVSNEFYSNHRHARSNINHFMGLLFNHVSEQLEPAEAFSPSSAYEMLSSVRSRIYQPDYRFYSVASSAHEIGMSKSNFQHLYKKHFGVSFMQDLINSRVERARMLLLTTNLTSTEIAKRCGYASFAHYTRQFKAQTGMTPLEFRRTAGESSIDGE